MSDKRLVVIETHPVQYHAPVYRILRSQLGIPTTVLYGSNFSLVGYHDQEFGVSVRWDRDLLSGYDSMFLSKASSGEDGDVEKISTKQIKQAIKNANPSAILLTGYNLPFYRAAFFCSRRMRIPIFFRAETTDHVREGSVFRRWVHDFILRWFYRRCDKLLFIGKHSYQHYRSLGCPEEKLIFSPYSVDADAFDWDEDSRNRLRPKARGDLGITETQKVLIFSGKLIPRKGADLLLRSVKVLPEQAQKEIVVLFVGDGQSRESLERLAKDHPFIRTHFVGFQNQSSLSQFYQAADLFVLPSHSDPWAVAVNEALQHGLPCVVSEAVGSAPDLIEPGVTGETFKTNSLPDLQRALQKTLPLVGKLSTRQFCRKKMEDYSSKKSAEGIERAFRSLSTHREQAGGE